MCHFYRVELFCSRYTCVLVSVHISSLSAASAQSLSSQCLSYGFSGEFLPCYNLLLLTAISIRASSLCHTVSPPPYQTVESCKSQIPVQAQILGTVLTECIHKKDHKLYLTTIHGPCLHNTICLKEHAVSQIYPRATASQAALAAAAF